MSLFCQHLEDSSEIQELTKYKPHVLLTQENTQIKELQQENKGKLECENKCELSYCVLSPKLYFAYHFPMNCLGRTMVVSGGTSVCARINHGSIPEANAPANDGQKGAGYQTSAQLT